MHRISDTLTQVQKAINEAAALSNRNDEDITLLAVSKKQSAERMREAVEAGIFHFGENYLSEAIEKQSLLTDCNICWHFIGPIQSNKTRAIAENFSWVHSVDRLKIAQRLSAQRPENLLPLNICLQINIDDEKSKSGLGIDAIEDLARELISLPKLKLRGLMVIPSRDRGEQALHEVFAKTRGLLQALEQALCVKLDTLSMGMSADLKPAIAEGATIVRIGTALFGQRHQ